MSNRALVEGSNKANIRDRIISFLQHGDIVLHADEERIMTRWMYVDALIRGRKKRRDEIISDVVKKFSVSKFTADQDIQHAHYVFGRTRQLNKTYLLGHLIEDLIMQIEKMKTDELGKMALPGLYRELRRAITDLPDDLGVDRAPPAVIMFNLFDSEKFNTGMTPEQAMERAKEFLRKQNIDDIEHEEID